MAFAPCSRRLGSSFLAVLLCTVSCLCALPSFAQTARTVRDELPEAARSDWDAARELYDAGDYKAALVQFERVYTLSKNPRVLFNVGVCWKNLTHYALAIRAWERELASRDELGKAEVSKVEAAIQAVRPFVSTVEVQANEPGATLSIDGNDVGKTPFIEPVPIDVGRRQVRLVKPDFIAIERSVEVVQGLPLTLTFVLEPLLKAAVVSVATTENVPGTLFMDGRELGAVPFRGELPSGPHTFEVRAPGYEAARQTSEVVFGRPLHLTFALVRARNEGKLRIITNHADASIQLDGKLMGYGAWEGLVPAGGHQLEVSRSGYEKQSSDVALSSDQERTIQINLNKSQSWVWWTVSLAAVVGGGTIAGVLLSRPTDTSAVTGTLSPGQVAPRN
jgi:hypothetical protein